MLVELFVDDSTFPEKLSKTGVIIKDESINEKLIVGGYAKKYDGGKKE
jgi:hypothetical protein